jgi:hypothetical protein
MSVANRKSRITARIMPVHEVAAALLVLLLFGHARLIPSKLRFRLYRGFAPAAVPLALRHGRRSRGRPPFPPGEIIVSLALRATVRIGDSIGSLGQFRFSRCTVAVIIFTLARLRRPLGTLLRGRSGHRATMRHNLNLMIVIIELKIESSFPLREMLEQRSRSDTHTHTRRICMCIHFSFSCAL